MSTQQNVLDLLAKNILLSDSAKTEIREGIGTLSATEKAALLLLLMDANDKQNILIRKTFSQNPRLLAELEALNVSK